jgi:hypothetical protein
MDYMFRCKTGRAGFAFRKATNARPKRPVPRSRRLLGSGTAGVVSTMLKSPRTVS